jgi:hypothetical protein
VCFKERKEGMGRVTAVIDSSLLNGAVGVVVEEGGQAMGGGHAGGGELGTGVGDQHSGWAAWGGRHWPGADVRRWAAHPSAK